jgi:hypothetical protein
MVTDILSPNCRYSCTSFPIFFSNFVPERLKNELHAGEILALLSNIMTERAFQGRLKGLRFGMSKRWSGYIPKIFKWKKIVPIIQFVDGEGIHTFDVYCYGNISDPSIKITS